MREEEKAPIQYDCEGRMTISIKWYGRTKKVYLHVWVSQLYYYLSFSHYIGGIPTNGGLYNKSIHKTLDDAVRKYIEDLNAYYGEREVNTMQTDSVGVMMLNIIINGNPTMVYLHADEDSDCYLLSYSDHPNSSKMLGWIYYKRTYKTLDDAITKYVEDLNAYYSEEE